MKCRAERKPLAKFPMELKSKRCVVFFRLPWIAKAGAAGVPRALRGAPAKGRAHCGSRNGSVEIPLCSRSVRPAGLQ